MSRCAFCGHPDQRHRIVDAIRDRIAAGERTSDVLNDYGWSLSGYLQVLEAVAQAEEAAKRRAGFRETTEALIGPTLEELRDWRTHILHYPDSDPNPGDTLQWLDSRIQALEEAANG